MPTYLVRMKEGYGSPRDLVGIFAADTLFELEVLVDECCDAFACEYVEMPSGGIYLSSPALPVPYGDIPEDGEADFFKGAGLCESWFAMMVNGHDVPEWISLAEPAWSSDEERQELIGSAMAKFIAFEEAKCGK